MFQNSYDTVKIRELTYKLDIMPGSPPRHEILGINIQIKMYSDFLLQHQIRSFMIANNMSIAACMQKYDKLFENNAKNGSFYLQSKVHRAKECLEELYQKKAEGNV